MFCSFRSSSSTSDSVTAVTWISGGDCEQVNPWDDHCSEGQEQPTPSDSTGTPRDRNKHTSSCREEPSDSTGTPRDRNKQTFSCREGYLM
ncbi:hypothetical protein CgunFtcFv8_020218 [Champsocephalus gunnari]|uniref:Uncharacterized protein n=1 Tax=Champsocephalus gunnari TaxID=52237 RepID=A0AAN8E420_CHAGU|nr:hypothetical protein CgunFtcFv8_020218 [Champsocephalus gunnari]